MRIKDNFNSKPDHVDIVNLVRSIQRAEGNIDCYRTGRKDCERLSCVWRAHCLKEPESVSKTDMWTKQDRNYAQHTGTE
jgi:hypothetical protein